jgi:hypothetical protein
MAKVPWLRLLDAAIGVTDLARTRIGRPAGPPDAQQQLELGNRALGGLETRLAGVVVAALKEAFERDNRRLDLEREQIHAERERAERALRLELRRQAGDREIGRLRLLGGVAIACWIGTLFFSPRVIAGSVGARVALGAGWTFLLVAFAAAFIAQSNVADTLLRSDDGPLGSGSAGTLALVFIAVGLALVGFAVLI